MSSGLLSLREFLEASARQGPVEAGAEARGMDAEGEGVRGEADMESLGQEVDPFATRQISHCPLWLSLTHPAPLGLDAVVQTWPRLCLYTFPRSLPR